MNITVPKKDLLRLVGRCQGVVDKKNALPVLANVLISVETPNLLRVAATNLYLAMSGETEAHIDQPGSTAVHARDLYDRIRAMPDGSISIEVGESGSTDVRSCSLPRRYRLQSLPVDSFPALPEPAPDAQELKLEVSVLSSLINQTQFSISSDESRPNLNSAFFQWEGDAIRMVTTDGHRLTKAETLVADRNANVTMLIPLKAITELRKLTEEIKSNAEDVGDSPTVTIIQSGPNAFFRFGDTVFCAKLVEAQFPPYQHVIPRASERVFRAPRVPWADALRAVALASDDRTGGVKISIETSTMKITSESLASGDGFDEIPIDYDDKPMTIALNAKYLMDILAVLDDDEVQVSLSGELDPIVIRPATLSENKSFVGIIMPMRT